MLDLSAEFGTSVEKRLREEEIIWFTSVSPGGRPVPNPVWFYWDGENILVYSQPSSFRVRNIKLNPNVALHLQGVDGAGSNVVIISGTAALETGGHTIPPGYWDKYSKFLAEIDTTAEGMARDYSVQIRVKPLRVRGE
jgi:PPOX class probable F420-dependent enzyme